MLLSHTPAGTCSAQAEFLLRGQLLSLLSAKRRAPGGSTSSAVAAATAAAAAAVGSGAAGSSSIGIAMVTPNAACVGQLDKGAIENAIAAVLVSLSLVMAGSGHLPTFRLIQILSRRAAAPLRPSSQPGVGPDGQPSGPGAVAALLGGPGVGTNSLNYGHHLAVSLAAGLLFLSGGRSSVSTSNESIAALLIALYPVWPCTPTDQRCHLQVSERGVSLFLSLLFWQVEQALDTLCSDSGRFVNDGILTGYSVTARSAFWEVVSFDEECSTLQYTVALFMCLQMRDRCCCMHQQRQSMQLSLHTHSRTPTILELAIEPLPCTYTRTHQQQQQQLSNSSALQYPGT